MAWLAEKTFHLPRDVIPPMDKKLLFHKENVERALCSEGTTRGSNTSILKRRFLVLRPQEPGSFQKETVPPRGEPSCPRQRGLWRWAEGRPPLPLTFTVKGDHHLPSAHPTPGIRDPNSLKNICGFRRLFFIVKLPRSSYHFRDEKKGS